MKQKTFPVEKSDLIALILTLGSLFLVSRIGILGGFNIGFSIGGILAFSIGFIYVFKKKADSKVFGVLLYMLTVALLLSFSLTNDNVIKFCTLVFLAFLSVFLLCSVSDNVSLKNGTYMSFINTATITVERVFEGLLITGKSYIEKITKNKSKNIVYIIIGVVISVVLLCIVLPLLSSSDIAFGSLVESIFKNGALLVVALIITLAMLPGIYSFMFSLRKQSREDSKKVKTIGKIPNVLFNIVLGAVSVVYCVYAVSQLAYITKAFAFLLPEDFTAAQFARSGFFQMGAISFINFALLAITAMLVKRTGKKIPVSTKSLLAFLCLFTMFYISTAIIKMLKYISLYGLTHLRVLTSVFMLMLAAIFFVMLLRVFIPKIKYAKAVVVICAMSLLCVSLVDTKTVIAEYNYTQYKQGKIQIDVEQIGSLGVSGIPTLVKLSEDEDKKVSDDAIRELMYVAEKVYTNAFDKEPDEEFTLKKDSFYQYNLSWLRAKKAIDEGVDMTMDYEAFNEYYYNEYLNEETTTEAYEEVF